MRSGDTPARDRARIVRKPPDILITTPESLHLMLTSRPARFCASVSHVIVDEIHSVCGNKRGVFLALLLERLEAISRDSFVRIGLSATQRPLDEVARYLGGQKLVGQAARGAAIRAAAGHHHRRRPAQGSGSRGDLARRSTIAAFSVRPERSGRPSRSASSA